MIKLPAAQYIDAEIQEYDGHPLINALPPINSPQDTARMLNRYPVVAEVEKSLPEDRPYSGGSVLSLPSARGDGK